MNAAFLCLGGNMGDRLGNLNEVKRQILALDCVIEAQSSVYQTKAWGVDEAPDYYNQIIKISTYLPADQLMQRLLAIEKNMGRVRTDNRNASRTMDIDILFFNNEIINTDLLEVPHPRLNLRNFVLVPLNEIASNYIHPFLNKSISDLLIECSDTSEVKKI